MNRFLIAAILTLIAVAVIAGPPHVDNVTNVSTKIIPEQGIKNAGAWVGATNTYAQGAIVKNQGQYYMAVIGGISTNLGPVHALGTADQARDGVTWRVFNPRKRNGFVVVNTGTNACSIALGYDAVGGSGIVLNANGGAFSLDNDSFQGSVHAELAVDDTNTVSTVVW